MKYEVELKTITHVYPSPWRCPCCKNDIIDGPPERYQTLDEHVSDPNRPSPIRTTLICSNSECMTRKKDIFWDHYGDMYGGMSVNDNEFIKSNNSPFGSLGRKLNVEIYKVGLKKQTYLSPAFLLWIYQPVIEYTYVANEEGNVIKRGFNINYLKKDDRINRNNYCIQVIPFWKTWKFLFGRFKRNIKAYENNLNPSSLISAFRPSYNRATQYIIFEKAMQILYRRHYNQYKIQTTSK